jgi:NADPH-dependent curcumin reductase CurA
LQEVISNRLKVLGFIVIDYIHKAIEVQEQLVQAWNDGRIVVADETETVVQSRFEDVPRTWLKLFDGSNTGKLTTELIQ